MLSTVFVGVRNLSRDGESSPERCLIEHSHDLMGRWDEVMERDALAASAGSDIIVGIQQMRIHVKVVERSRKTLRTGLVLRHATIDYCFAFVVSY